jgi:RNA polymerase sigma-70 factor, ECF subfamily
MKRMAGVTCVGGASRLSPSEVSATIASEDRRTIERMIERDAAALADLYDRYARPVYSLACRILSDRTEAEDVVQEVFSQAWRQAGAYDARRAPVAGWLLMMARTRAIDRLRARNGRVQTVPSLPTLPDLPDSQQGPEALAIGEEEAARVRAALETLTDSQRSAIQLAYYEGLSQSDIAERLREPLGTVKTRIRTGLLKLRSALRADMPVSLSDGTLGHEGDGS